MRFALWLLALLALLILAACAARSTNVATGARTDGFTPATLTMFAERDVQYTGSTPHCIFRFTLAEAPDGIAMYAEAEMTWCEGVPR